MPIEPGDLPPDIQAILNMPAREGACINEQPVCHPDQRVTAQLTDDPPPDSMLKPWRIANAKKGDLFLSPGGPSGLIGGLLSRLDDPQFYSHMGIMVADEVAIRHTTASSDRATHDHFTTGTVFGTPAPTDGYEEVALRFQWPGTLTQTIEQAFLTWRDHPKELDSAGQSRKYPTGREVPHKDFSFHDPVTNERFHIDAFSFEPNAVQLRDGTWKDVWPLVVKPCQDLETTEVRRALHRIADASKEIRAHYRLFAYTEADIPADPARLGPPMFEDRQRDPNIGCTGARPILIPVSKTVPLVCSTFVWWAVQEANRVGIPKIFVDARPLDRRRRDELVFACLQNPLLEWNPHPNDERVHVVVDGLYRYSEKERQRAGEWLHDEYVVPLVRSKIDKALPFVLRAAGATGFWSLSNLLNAFSLFPLGTVARMLGVSTLVLNELIAWMTDMPDDVANQLCNTFAFDRSDSAATDSDEWRNPGTGLSVSPDDMINEWAPPQSQTPEEIHGVYGFNEQMILRPPEFVRNPPPPSTWQISQGFAEFKGQVFLRDPQGNAVGVRGAHVRIGCETWITGDNGIYFTPPAPTGLYWGVASYTDPTTGLLCEAAGRRIHVGVPGGSTSEFQFELRLPPDTRREVIIRGKMDLTNRHLIGKDWHDHPQFVKGPAFLDIDFFFFPDSPEYKAQREASQKQTLLVSRPVEDWGHAEIEFQLAIQPDKSVFVTYRARLKEENDDPWQESGTMMVPPKQANSNPGTAGPVVDMMRKPFSPVRAHIEFEVHNNWAR